MERPRRHLANSAKRAIAAIMTVLAAAVCLTLYCSQSRLPEIAQLAMAHRSLPARHAFSKYAWLSSNEVIIGTQNSSDNTVLWRVDIASDRNSKLTNLNEVLSNLNKRNRRVIDWSLGGGQTLALCDGGVSGASNAMTLDLSGRILGEAELMSGLRRVYPAMWLPDLGTWILVGLSNNATIGLVWNGRSEIAGMLLSSNIAFPVGAYGGSQVILLEAQKGATVSKMRLLHSSFRDHISTSGFDIRLPFECQVVQARLSPSGRRILWELRRFSRFAKIAKSPVFPFLTFRKDIGESSIWISNSDGTGFSGLCLLGEGRIGNCLEWHRDEKKISMIMDGQLFIFGLQR